MKRKNSFLETVIARNTLWFAAIFSIFCVITFILVYLNSRISLRDQMDNSFLEELSENENIYSQKGIKELENNFIQEALSEGTDKIFFMFLSPDGEIIVSSNNLDNWPGIREIISYPQGIPKEGLEFKTILLSSIGGEDHVRIVQKKDGRGNVLLIGETLDEIEKFLHKYSQIFIWVFLVMLFCGSFVGWLMTKRTMSGVDQITKTALRISEGDLSLRVVNQGKGKEIDDLSKAFNNMLERIECLVEELKNVTDNIAHDLRSPLTRIRGISETTLIGAQNIEAYQKMTQDIIAETDQFLGMINTMLDIALTEAGVVKIDRAEVDIKEIVKDACQLFMPLAEEKNIKISQKISKKPLIIIGDRSRLQRLVANVLDNAIKYTPQQGKVEVSLQSNATHMVVSIADTGTGINPQDLEHIFKRFYRTDKSRSLPGNGLGLSLAQTIAWAHKGTISVTSVPGKGSTFTIFLPIYS